MTMTRFTYFILGAIALGLTFSSCKKEFDEPPVPEIPTGNVKTISELKALYFSQGAKSISEEWSTFGVVSADETSGNIYRTVYIQDATDAITLRLLSSGGVYQGDSVRVYLKGTRLDDVNGVISIDSVDVDQNIVKQSTGNQVQPLVLTIDQLTDGQESKLVQLNDVQFTDAFIGQTYADAVTLSSKNTEIEDCDGNIIIVRNSGYANFANEIITANKGTLVGVLSEFNGDKQIFLRALTDVQMNDTVRCNGQSSGGGNPGGGNPGGSGQGIFSDDFESEGFSLGGWTTQTVQGNADWFVDDFSNNFFAKITNFSAGSNTETEAWLISPSIDLSAVSSATLSFENAFNYSGAPLELYISTDYSSGLPSTATWTQVSFNLSTGNWDFVNSGAIDLSAYTGNNNVRFAFKYIGSNSDGSTWEVDNVLVE